jgi:hypothetical protein
MTTISFYFITGIMVGIEMQTFEECDVLVIDLFFVRIMIERD